MLVSWKYWTRIEFGGLVNFIVYWQHFFLKVEFYCSSNQFIFVSSMLFAWLQRPSFRWRETTIQHWRRRKGTRRTKRKEDRKSESSTFLSTCKLVGSTSVAPSILIKECTQTEHRTSLPFFGSLFGLTCAYCLDCSATVFSMQGMPYQDKRGNTAELSMSYCRTVV